MVLTLGFFIAEYKGAFNLCADRADVSTLSATK